MTKLSRSARVMFAARKQSEVEAGVQLEPKQSVLAPALATTDLTHHYAPVSITIKPIIIL